MDECLWADDGKILTRDYYSTPRNPSFNVAVFIINPTCTGLECTSVSDVTGWPATKHLTHSKGVLWVNAWFFMYYINMVKVKR
jgi:hypothetical protein